MSSFCGTGVDFNKGLFATQPKLFIKLFPFWETYSFHSTWMRSMVRAYQTTVKLEKLLLVAAYIFYRLYSSEYFKYWLHLDCTMKLSHVWFNLSAIKRGRARPTTFLFRNYQFCARRGGRELNDILHTKSTMLRLEWHYCRYCHQGTFPKLAVLKEEGRWASNRGCRWRKGAIPTRQKCIQY